MEGRGEKLGVPSVLLRTAFRREKSVKHLKQALGVHIDVRLVNCSGKRETEARM